MPVRAVVLVRAAAAIKRVCAGCPYLWAAALKLQAVPSTHQLTKKSCSYARARLALGSLKPGAIVPRGKQPR